MNVLGVSVERDHVGLALVGGTNFVAAARECEIDVVHESISDLLETSQIEAYRGVHLKRESPGKHCSYTIMINCFL